MKPVRKGGKAKASMTAVSTLRSRFLFIVAAILCSCTLASSAGEPAPWAVESWMSRVDGR
jgi:hypothetical protein